MQYIPFYVLNQTFSQPDNCWSIYWATSNHSLLL